MKDISEILIVGGDSKIGRDLELYYKRIGTKVWTTTRHREATTANKIFLDLSLDLSNFELPSDNINTVLFCAAITSLEYCEIEFEKSRQVNVSSILTLTRHFNKFRIFVVFLSTNLVFDGETSYVSDTHVINPLTKYGQLKAEAEINLLQLNGNLAIIRLGKVLIPNNSFINNWINDLNIGKLIYPFYDMVVSPVSLDLVIQIIVRIIENKMEGIFQVTATKDITYEEAAKYLVQEMKYDMNLIKPISYMQKDIKFSAKHSTLDCLRLLDIGLSIQEPTVAIDNIIKNLK
jgi:dTDP-4-dehydrorhamnose reductase